MDWPNTAKPSSNQDRNSWSNTSSYRSNASNYYNNQAGGYGNQDNSTGNSYSTQGNSYTNAEFGNSRKRSYNSFQGPNARSYDVQNNRNQGNPYPHQNPYGHANSYEVAPQFRNNQVSGSYNNNGRQYNNNPHSYNDRQMGSAYDNFSGTIQNRPNSQHTFGQMSKGKARNERKKFKHEQRASEKPDRVREILVETKQIVFIQLKESAKILSTPGSSRLGSKTSQVVHDRLRMIIGDDKNPVSESLLQEYRDIYPASLDERFVNAVKKRLEGEEADDEAELLSDRDKAVMQHTPLTLKDQAVKKQLSQLPSNPLLNVRKKILPKGSTAFQARLTLTVDDIDRAIAIRAEQIKELMLEVDDHCPMDDVHNYVDLKLIEGGATLIKNQLARMLSKGLIRPDADEEYLMLRILGQPKLPPQLCMEEFLEPYTVRELKKSFKNKHLIVLRVKTRKDYEDLLAKDEIVVAGLPLSIKKADTMDVNLEQYLRKNKTWIQTDTKEEQEKSEKKRLDKLEFLKEKTIENKKRRLLIYPDKAKASIEQRKTQQDAEYQTDTNDQKGFDGEGHIEGQEKMGSQGDTEGHGDTEGQENMEGQGNTEGKGDTEGQGDTESTRRIEAQVKIDT